MAGGVLAGYPLVDVKATLFDGSYHDVDSSEMAFKVAASLALKEAKNKCNVVLLEHLILVQISSTIFFKRHFILNLYDGQILFFCSQENEN